MLNPIGVLILRIGIWGYMLRYLYQGTPKIRIGNYLGPYILLGETSKSV